MEKFRRELADFVQSIYEADKKVLVFGEGRVGAPVMMIGEAPGEQETLLGRPFVGKAGKNLDAFLEQAGMDVSGLNSMSDAEAMLGMTMDEMMAQSGQAEGMDSFSESLFNLETVKDLAKDINTDGVYSVTGDTLLLDGDDEMTISFPDADTLRMDGDDGGTGLLPLTLERVQ